jgi:arsenate reductase
MTITIYHNPRCQTSRNVLAYLREAGHEPRIIEYLKTPPSRFELKGLVKRMGGKMRDIVRGRNRSPVSWVSTGRAVRRTNCWTR